MLRNGNECGKRNIMSVTRQPFPIQIKTTEERGILQIFGSITTYARFTREPVSMISMAKAEFSKKKRRRHLRHGQYPARYSSLSRSASTSPTTATSRWAPGRDCD
jgi:hypothetical protein